MKLISAQPNDPYFAWQLEIQINNFRKYNLADSMQVLIFNKKENKKFSHIWEEIVKDYPEVHFFFYNDHGCKHNEYKPAVRPHILKQHFQKYPELTNETFFYHDADIIFTKEPRLDLLLNGNTIYVSDTKSYLNSIFLNGKVNSVKNESFKIKFEQEKIVKKISEIVGISEMDFVSNDNNMGGAQYILKNINWQFWEKVERHCVDIYRYFGHINRTYFVNENKGIQRWCADMWSVALNLIKEGRRIEINSLLDFSWPNNPINHDSFIYHNSGVSSKERTTLFWKGGYREKNPFEIDHDIYVKKDVCNYLYVKEISELSKNDRVVNRYKNLHFK